MSEYQYYEFVVIDEPLTPKQMSERRACASRASITPTRFVNDYQWGDLKGDPADWMRRHFDAHVYVANWCTCLLCLRVPIGWLAGVSAGEFDEKVPNPNRQPDFLTSAIQNPIAEATWNWMSGSPRFLRQRKPRCSNCC